MGGEDELKKLLDKIIAEVAKNKRCEAKGIRFKNKVPLLQKQYAKLMRNNPSRRDLKA